MTITRYQHCQLDDAPNVNTQYASSIKAIRLRLQNELTQKQIQKAIDNPLPTW